MNIVGGRGASAKGSGSGGGSRSGSRSGSGSTVAGYRSAVTVGGVLFDAFVSSLEGGVGGGRRVRSDDRRPDDEEASR